MEDIVEITMITSDGQRIKTDSKECERSEFVKGLLEDFRENTEIKLEEITASTLEKVLSYLRHYKSSEPKKIPKPMRTPLKDNVDKWDYDFINVDINTVGEIIVAANFLRIIPLLELGCAHISGLIQGKNVEEMRQILGIENDFTPEEYAEAIEDNRCVVDVDDEEEQ